MKTIRLYDTHPYDTTFFATVVSCEVSGDIFDVVLDQTLFFPEQGGQTCDRGTLNGSEVVDVRIKDNIIHHFVKSPMKGEVKGVVDFELRFYNMQHHTCEHILTSVTLKLFGLSNIGIHIGRKDVTVDFERPFSETELFMIEEAVNDLIYKNVHVKTYFVEPNSTLDYRSRADIKEDIRIVEIEGVDICACCAPHVARTGEIGLFKILRTEKKRDGVRLYFAVGKKAFIDYQIKHQQALTLSSLLNMPSTSLVEPVDKLLNENNALKTQLNQIQKAALLDQVAHLEVKDVQVLFVEALESKQTKDFVASLMEKTNQVAYVFVQNGDDYRFIISGKSPIDELLSDLKAHFSVRGGGRGLQAQGTIVATKEALEAYLQAKYA